MQAPMQAFERIPPPGKAGMLNDIWETPKALRSLLQEHIQDANSSCPVTFRNLDRLLPDTHALAGQTPLAVMAGANFPNKITMVGAGTSYHSALVAEYLIEQIARISVNVEYASEFRYGTPLFTPGDVLVIVSSSGETYDAVESLRAVKRCEAGPKVLTVAFVNEADSTIGRESDVVVEVMAGMEVGVASTKVFSSMLLCFVLLAVALGSARGTLPEGERKVLLEKVRELPGHVQEVLDQESRPLCREGDGERFIAIGECMLWDMGCQNVLADNFMFLGRGLNFPIAMEGAMKCKEVAYIHAEGLSSAEMKHGPIALIDQFMPVVFIAPRADPMYGKIKSSIEEVKARNGATIAITEHYNTELEETCEYVIRVPATHEYLMPILSVIPLQLLAYMMGILRGNEVDHPRNLLKVSTAENG